MVRLYARPESPYWYAEIEVGGNSVRVSTGVPTGPGNRGRARTEAETKRAGLEAERLASVSLTFAATVGRFIDEVTGLKPSTLKNYGKALVNSMVVLGLDPIVSIDPPRCKLYIKERRDQGASDVTIRTELNVMSSVFEWVIDHDIEPAVTINPVRLTRKKHLAMPASHSRAIRPALVIRILDAARVLSPNLWFPFLTLMLETGLRPGEVFKLQWSDVDFDRMVIDLPWEKEKTSRGRIIPLTDTALNTLRSVRRYAWSTWVFTSKKSKGRYTSYHRSWGLFLAKAELPRVRVHDFRHTFASYTRRLGMDRLDRKNIMGHSSEESHELYSATDEHTLREVLNAHSPSTLLAHERDCKESVVEETE